MPAKLLPFISFLLPNGQSRQVDSRRVKALIASSKGGHTTQAKGTAKTRFTTASGRKANLASQGRLIRRIGVRVGRTRRYRSYVKRAPLRALYALKPVLGIQYMPAWKVWLITDSYGTRPITERTALRRLGHLPPANGHVPRTIFARSWKP